MNKFKQLEDLALQIKNYREAMIDANIESQEDLKTEHDNLIDQYRELHSDLEILEKFYADATIELIQEAVSKYYEMTIEVMNCKTRKREVVQARQISMYFSKHMTKKSLAIIGADHGGKDHGTVLHACKTISNLIETDKLIALQVNEIRYKIHKAIKKASI